MSKIVGLLLMLLASSCLNCSAQSINAKESLMCWNKNNKLKWADFQAQKNPVLKGGKNKYSADAAVDTEIRVEGIFDSVGVVENNFVVTVVLNRSNSWVRDSATSSPKLLAHEQLHFDIAELFGRKLRRRIAQARATGIAIFSPEFGRVIQSMLDEHGLIQDCYDDEVWLNEGQQIEWQNCISAELSKLEQYSSSEATCKR